MSGLTDEQRDALDQSLADSGCHGFLGDHPDLYTLVARMVAEAEKRGYDGRQEQVERGLDAAFRIGQQQGRAKADRHPEDYCHRCDGPNISWFTPGGVWDPVMRPVPGAPWKWNEIICPLCFVELAGGGSWTLTPMKGAGEAWTSADERALIKAQAWDEGWRAGRGRGPGHTDACPVAKGRGDNPYRADDRVGGDPS